MSCLFTLNCLDAAPKFFSRLHFICKTWFVLRFWHIHDVCEEGSNQLLWHKDWRYIAGLATELNVYSVFFFHIYTTIAMPPHGWKQLWNARWGSIGKGGRFSKDSGCSLVRLWRHLPICPMYWSSWLEPSSLCATNKLRQAPALISAVGQCSIVPPLFQ